MELKKEREEWTMFEVSRRDDDLFNRMLKTFNSMFPRSEFFPFGEALSNFSTDIIEKDDAYYVKAELPGFDKENITIELDDNYLIIKAKREESAEEKNDAEFYIRKERRYGEFVRQFYIDNVDKDKIRATLENGILKIELPKLRPGDGKRKQITIE